MYARNSDNGASLEAAGVAAQPAVDRVVLNHHAFRRLISLERKRSERSRKPFLLMLLNMGESLPSEKSAKSLGEILDTLSRAVRETDTTGWYEDHSTVGVMFTEIGHDEASTSLNTLTSRVTETLRSSLTVEQFNHIRVSFHIYPEDWEQNDRQPPSNPRLYPDLMQREEARKTSRAIKRAMDIAGSLAALAVLSPVFLIVAIAVKLTSKGPVFFRQRRVGQYGVAFSLLKFRSMYDGNHSHVHREYMRRLIAGVAEKHPSDSDDGGVYKLTGDSRITAVGALLRRTSLDELPQFINVLKGEMSLVGPRPPIDYEVERYELWHRRRLIEAKPGITGLWQVTGRNRIAFDDMVRLDLRYAQLWSPWVDLKILLRTPKAVIEGAH